MAAARAVRQAFWRDPERLLLLLVTAGGVLAAVLFASVSPDGRAPDEYRYVEDVLRLAGSGGWTTVTGHPPLYPALGVLVHALLPSGDAWHYVMRLLGAVAVAVTVIATYGAARELFPRRPLARWLPVVLVAFLPQFGFIAASVNSDGMLAAECAVAFYLLVRLLMRGPTTRPFVCLVVLTVLGVLTKQRFLVILPMELAVVAFVALRAVRQRRGAEASGPRRHPRAWLAVAGMLVIVLAGLGVLVWAPPIAPSGLARALAPAAAMRVLTLPYFGIDLFTSFWGYFDWLAVPMHAGAYWFYLALCALAFAGLVLGAARIVSRAGLRGLFRHPFAGAWALVIAAPVLTFYSVVLYQVGGLGAQGRYLFIALVPFALAIGGGLDALVPSRWSRWVFAGCAMALAGILAVEVASRLVPYYY